MNRASAETQKEIAEEEGLWPVLNWAKQLLDDVVEREFGAPQLEFAWGQDQQIDPSQQAVILSTYVKSGVLTINEARAQLGMVPLSEPAANTALTLTANGYVGIGAGATKKLARALAVRQAHREGDGSAQSFNYNDIGLSDRRNPSSLTVSLSNREGRSSLDKYSPDQPRVPAGQSDGGQWTSGAGGSTSLLDDGVYRSEEDTVGVTPAQFLPRRSILTNGRRVLELLRDPIGFGEEGPTASLVMSTADGTTKKLGKLSIQISIILEWSHIGIGFRPTALSIGGFPTTELYRKAESE